MIAPRGRFAPAAALLLLLGAGPAGAQAAPEGDLAARVGRLYGGTRAPAVPGETLEYRVEAGPLGAFRGSARWTVKPEEVAGRAVLRLTQTTSVAGRRQEAETLLDAGGLFPLEHTRRVTGEDGVTHRDTVMWDQLSGRVYCESSLEREGRMTRVLDRQEKRLGVDLPGELLDPLGALLRYRLMAAASGKAPGWTVPVVEGCDEVYTATFTPRGEASVEDPARGKVPAELVEQGLAPRGAGLAGRTVSLTLEAGGSRVPRRFSGPLAGGTGTITLTGSRAE